MEQVPFRVGWRPSLCRAGAVGLLTLSLVGAGVALAPVTALAEGETEGIVETHGLEQSMSLTTRQFRFADDGGQDAASLVWESSDEAVATVNEEGLVTAVAPGTATITASGESGVVSTTEVTVAEPAYSADYDLMQDRWLRRIVGSTPSEGPLDMSDDALVTYANKQLADAQGNWDTVKRDEDGNATCWERIASDSDSANFTSQLKKLRPLVIAFGMNLEGNDLYQNRALYEDIMSVLDYFVSPDGMDYGSQTKDWTEFNSTGVVSNWWDWQIGCPGRLADMLIVMSDYCDFEQIEPVVDAVGKYCVEPEDQLNAASGWVTSTGSNRTDIANAMMGMAIVSHDGAEKLVLVDEQVPTVLQEVTTGDGIYADGSIVQHTAQAYTGSYGNELIKGVAKITAILADTEWAFNDPGIYNLYNAVSTGYIPLMHGSEMMSMVNGRAAARVQDTAPYSSEKYWGNETIANLLNIAQSAPEPYKTEFLSTIKGWLLDAGDFYFDNARDFDAMLLAKDLLNDSSIAATTYEGMRVFGSMDRVVQQTESYAAGLSMYSTRIYNYECMNGENKHGWHQGDGVLYVYTDDDAYDIGYWATVDPYRLPGTTVDTRELPSDLKIPMYSTQDWVGGATDGTNGAAGMSFDTSNLVDNEKQNLGMNLVAKKSYFFLDGKIVELGAGITGTTDATIETTVENRMMTAGDAAVTVDGTAWNGEKNVELEDGSYVTLAGTTDNSSMGYYFIDGAPVEMSKETNTGSYAEINDSFPYAEEFTRSYFKLGINHGKSVENGTYGFIVMPGATTDSMAAYAANPTVEVLANTSEVQAVRDSATGAIAANVWAEGGATVGGITVNGPASIYAVEQDGVLKVYVSDPTHLSSSVTVKVDNVAGTVSLDDTVTDNLDGTYTASVDGTAGATHAFEVRLAEQVSTDDLEAAIDQVGSLNASNYTPESWAALQAALAQANAALASGDQASVDSALAALNNAISALKPATGTKPGETQKPGGNDGSGTNNKPAGTTDSGKNNGKPSQGKVPETGDAAISVAPVAAIGAATLAAALVVRKAGKRE